jgi:aryl-alcohol dehydrogenase-like predicted oxidoreductase
VHARLAALRAQGIVIGLTLSGPRQAETLRRALGVRIGGRRLFDTVQATWNLLEPSVGPALAEAAAAGLGVIVKEAVANGRLTERNAESDFADHRRQLQHEAARLGTTLDGLALAAALAQPWVSCVLSGAATAAQLQSNAAAAALTLEQGTAERLATLLAEPPAVYWQRRSTLAWT